MGLAPYGEGRFTQTILDELIDLKPDGSFRMNMSYFGYLDDLEMTNARFEALFGGPPRQPESPITKREMDLARSIQEVTEEVALRMARHARERTGKSNLCLAGGVALNCVANGQILRAGIFDDLWIQPAAGDAGGALGAALAIWHNALGHPRSPEPGRDTMRGSYLGPEFSPDQIREYLDARGCKYRELSDAEWAPAIAELLAREQRGRALPGAHGVRPARARQSLDRRRRALTPDAVGDEPEDQVPRELPAVRAGLPRGAARRLLRDRPAVAVHAARRAAPRRAPPADDRRRRAARSTSTNG